MPNIQPHRDYAHWYDPSGRPGVRRSSTDLWIRFLLLVLFALVVFALGHAMVRNHFFSGGALNNHQGHMVGPR